MHLRQVLTFSLNKFQEKTKYKQGRKNLPRKLLGIGCQFAAASNVQEQLWVLLKSGQLTLSFAGVGADIYFMSNLPAETLLYT